MGRILLTALLLALMVSDADARRRHHRHWRGAPVMMLAPGMEFPGEMRAVPEERRGMPEERRGRRERGESTFIPAGWTLQAEDPNFSGRRYMAPDGSAWLALYSAPVDKDKVAEHLKNVAFADGEQVTYIRGARDWLAVSGLKGERVYYRKAMLACGGTAWRHIAWEYPAEQKASLDRAVERAAQMFDRIAEESCAGDMFSHPKS